MHAEKKIAILGLGLMGGSLGLALKGRGYGGCVQGYARRAETVRHALEHGLCDHAGSEAPEAVVDADLVVVCVPVLSIPSLIREVRGALKPGAVITDVGSTKAWLHAEVEKILDGTKVSFVGSHPVAGSEKSGAEAARSDLYAGARCVLTGNEATPEPAMLRVATLWNFAGCRVSVMDPESHDRMLARTSHLPHLVSSALAMAVSRPDGGAPEADFCGPGYRSMTRLACGSPGMWRDIFESNRSNLLHEMEAIRSDLAQLHGLIERNEM
ncbi:MAG: prephenate dehydrogenase/arogenate dehydrogenase family protein, partial [Kiritimatiellae bacterium]|nr:prephenate dehydrogenase/arogenate dehydrogenase family protein [Kiritimatiellia bacterium]